jgi:nuclear pore complex protein Nup54
MGINPQLEAQQQCILIDQRVQEMQPVLERAAGQLSMQSLQQSMTMQSSLAQSFVAYSYSYTENQQVLMQANQFNPQQHVDQAKWAQAVQNNLDPRCCVPEPLVGLRAIENRIQSQQRAMDQSTAALDELKQGFGNLKDSLQAQSMQKLEECRQRHQKLSRQLLQVVAQIETFAVTSGAARRSPHLEAQLEERFARLEDAVHAPSSARARLEELWVVLRGLLQRGSPSGGAAKLSDVEADKTLQLTAAQGELLEALQEELARRNSDIQQFESALQRFTTAPLAPRSI